MNEIAQAFKNNLRLFAYWWVVAFGVLFFASYDSYTHDLFYRCDSAWFFMCGKAWMNGLVPYVDFADCKGPLLWLIYGIGYLIDNDSYIGMFWIETVFYAITLLYAYKIAKIWLDDARALFVAGLLPIALFFPAMHNEMRADNFCFPFQAAALYYMLKTIYQQDVYKKASLACGILFGVSLLIKWNISIMSLGIWSPLLWHLRSGKKIVQSVTVFLVGMALIVLPIVLSFCYMGCFGDFIDAYFIKAYTAKSGPSFSDLIIKYFTEEVPDLLLFHSPLISLFAYVTVAGALVFGLKQKQHRAVPVLMCLWHFALAARVGNYYYYLVTVVFTIFAIIAILMRITLPQRKARYAAVAIAVLMPFVVALENGEFWRRPFLCNDPQWQKTFWEIGYKMSAVKKAKVMNFAYEIGFSTPSDALPAARFWSDIWGRNDIREVREQYVKDQMPEFITVIDARDESRSIQLIVNNGYLLCYSGEVCVGTVSTITKYKMQLYRRADVPDVAIPDDFKITVWDVLLKRNPIKGR